MYKRGMIVVCRWASSSSLSMSMTALERRHDTDTVTSGGEERNRKNNNRSDKKFTLVHHCSPCSPLF